MRALRLRLRSMRTKNISFKILDIYKRYGETGKLVERDEAKRENYASKILRQTLLQGFSRGVHFYCFDLDFRQNMAVEMQPRFSTSKVERFRFTRYESVDTNMPSPTSPSTPISPKDYEIHIATAKDRTDILKFLQKFFFKDEPLNKYLGIICEETPECPDLEHFSLKEIDNNVTLKAVYNGQIIGVCLNSILEKGKYENEECENYTDRKFQKICALLETVTEQADIFSKFPGATKAITTKIISVNGAFRGQGIAKELMNKTRESSKQMLCIPDVPRWVAYKIILENIRGKDFKLCIMPELAKEHGCTFMTVDCSSHFTALALKKLGFELKYSLKYSDYKVNGEVVFKPEPPHDAITVYAQKIN